MNIIEMKQFLGTLYKGVYKDDKVIQMKLVQMGWAIERLLENGRISPFDDYDKVSKLIFNELDVNQTERRY